MRLSNRIYMSIFSTGVTVVTFFLPLYMHDKTYLSEYEEKFETQLHEELDILKDSEIKVLKIAEVERKNVPLEGPELDSRQEIQDWSNKCIYKCKICRIFHTNKLLEAKNHIVEAHDTDASSVANANQLGPYFVYGFE